MGTEPGSSGGQKAGPTWVQSSVVLGACLLWHCASVSSVSRDHTWPLHASVTCCPVDCSIPASGALTRTVPSVLSLPRVCQA